MVGNFCNRTACRIRNRRPRHDNNMTLRKKENPKSLPTLHGLESTTKIFAPSSRRGVFSLVSHLYRSRQSHISNSFVSVKFFLRALPDALRRVVFFVFLDFCIDDLGSFV